MADETSEQKAARVRSMPRWVRWILFALVFGGTALAFYFNFGRLFGRLFD